MDLQTKACLRLRITEASDEGPCCRVRRDPRRLHSAGQRRVAAGITSFVRALDLVTEILALQAQVEHPGQQEAKVDAAIRALGDAIAGRGNRS